MRACVLICVRECTCARVCVRARACACVCSRSRVCVCMCTSVGLGLGRPSHLECTSTCCHCRAHWGPCQTCPSSMPQSPSIPPTPSWHHAPLLRPRGCRARVELWATSWSPPQNRFRLYPQGARGDKCGKQKRNKQAQQWRAGCLYQHSTHHLLPKWQQSLCTVARGFKGFRAEANDKKKDPQQKWVS